MIPSKMDENIAASLELDNKLRAAQIERVEQQRALALEDHNARIADRAEHLRLHQETVDDERRTRADYVAHLQRAVQVNEDLLANSRPSLG